MTNKQKTLACGIIPVKKENDKWLTFVVQHKAGHWGFPKGHKEGTESDKETAERELIEETGLRIKNYLPIAPFNINYQCTSHGKEVDKTVILFVAAVTGQIKLCPVEIINSQWIEIDKLNNKIDFPQMIEIINELQILLTSL